MNKKNKEIYTKKDRIYNLPCSVPHILSEPSNGSLECPCI